MAQMKNDFRRSLQHQVVHPVPYVVKFTHEALDKYRAFAGADFDPILDTGSYVVASHTNNGWQEIRPGYFQDFFGVVWNKTEDKTLGVVDQYPLTGPSLDGFAFPDPDHQIIYDFINENNRKYPEHFHMVSIGFTLFERAWSLVGMENLMLYFSLEPSFVKELLERIGDFNIALIRNAASLGVDCVHFGDDWGSQRGPMISPVMWREFVGPVYGRMCAAAKDCNLLISQHSCGQVEEFLPDMVEAGVDLFDPFQPEVMDIFAVYNQYHGRMAFMGGLSVQKTLPFGTPDDVERETRELLEHLGSKGGYVLAPSHSLTGDIPVENIDRFIQTAMHQ